MTSRELKLNEVIELPDLTINSIVDTSDAISLNFSSINDFETNNSISIHSGNNSFELRFKKEVSIKIIDLVSVECEDWFQDDNIPQSSVNQPGLKWNDDENIAEYNSSKTIGDGLNLNYLNYIDIEFAEVFSITKVVRHDQTMFELILNTSYTETSKDNTLSTFYSGPFKFYCNRILIETDL